MKIDETIEYAKFEQTNFSKEYRLYREKWNSVPVKHELTNFPLHLDIEINTSCNLKCKMCAFHGHGALYEVDGTQVNMPLYLYKQIIDEGSEHGLRAIKLNYRGEPLMHSDIIEMVRYAKEKGIIDVMFNTNGMLMTAHLSEALLEAGLDQVFFSIDDHRAEVYDKFRDGADFQRVLLNLMIFKITRDIKRSHCHIRVSRIDFPSKEDTRRDFEARFGPYADSIGYQCFYDYNGVPIDNDDVSDYECAYPWQRMLVLVDGTIVTCCNDPDPTKKLGKFPEISLFDAWHSTKFWKLRKFHQAHNTHMIPQCRHCHMRNKFMNT